MLLTVKSDIFSRGPSVCLFMLFTMSAGDSFWRAYRLAILLHSFSSAVICREPCASISIGMLPSHGKGAAGREGMASQTGGIGHKWGTGRVLRFGFGGVDASAGVIRAGKGPGVFCQGAFVARGRVSGRFVFRAWLCSLVHSAFRSWIQISHFVARACSSLSVLYSSPWTLSFKLGHSPL